MWPTGKIQEACNSHTAAHQPSRSRTAAGISRDSPGVPGLSEGPASRSRGGTWVSSLAAKLCRSSAVHSSSRPPSCLQHGMWPQPPSLSRFLPGAPTPASRRFLAFPSAPVRVPASAVRARNLGAVRPRSPASPSLPCSLARPPAALTWAPRGALPAKRWRPGRRAPRSGRGEDPCELLGCGLLGMGPKNSLVLRRRPRNVKIYQGKTSFL